MNISLQNPQWPTPTTPSFEAFEVLVAQMLDEIPAKYLADLQGVHVLPDLKRDPNHSDLLRMGEYLDPGPDSFLGFSVGLGRHVALFYGSFVALAAGNPNFDWEGQTWEVLTHELQHHVESKAGERGLIEWDIQQMRRFARERALRQSQRKAQQQAEQVQQLTQQAQQLEQAEQHAADPWGGWQPTPGRVLN
jgi:hypothetical protein